jgi:hypothetical protein
LWIRLPDAPAAADAGRPNNDAAAVPAKKSPLVWTKPRRSMCFFMGRS